MNLKWINECSSSWRQCWYEFHGKEEFFNIWHLKRVFIYLWKYKFMAFFFFYNLIFKFIFFTGWVFKKRVWTMFKRHEKAVSGFEEFFDLNCRYKHFYLKIFLKLNSFLWIEKYVITIEIFMQFLMCRCTKN